jgi:hypothetical protein
MRRTAVVLGAVVLFLAAGFDLVRDPNAEVPIVWETGQVTMTLQQDGSKDIKDGSAFTAIRNAFATWNAVACSRFRFVDGGLTASRDIAQDGTNLITWVDTNWPGAMNGAGAYTNRYLEMGSPDRWVEADIQINGQDFSWATDGTPHVVDVQSAVLHELGHVMGFAHSSNPQAVMYFRMKAGSTYARTLSADDINGACFLYPQAPLTCASDEECHLYSASYGGVDVETHCSNGSCAAGATSMYGAACFSGGDCTSGHCLVDPSMPPATEPGFCSRVCSAGNCPNGDFCDAKLATPLCFIGRDDCIVDSDCTRGPGWVCSRDLDGRSRCLLQCMGDADCASVPGSGCSQRTMTDLGLCRVPGPKLAGERCRSGLDCASLLCTAGGAEPACAPAASVDAALGEAGSGDASTDATQDTEVHADGSVASDSGPSSSSRSGGCSCASADVARSRASMAMIATWTVGLAIPVATRRKRSAGRAGSDP